MVAHAELHALLMPGDVAYANGISSMWDEFFTTMRPLLAHVPLLTALLNLLGGGLRFASNAAMSARRELLALAVHDGYLISAQAMRHIGIALADLQKTIDPEVFVLGGGVASVGDFFFHGVQAAADEYAQGFAAVTIRRAQLGTNAGVIGAALAARHG